MLLSRIVGWFTGTGELFSFSVHQGKVLLERGRPPAGFTTEVSTIVARARVKTGTIRAVTAEHGFRLVVSGGIDERTEQRLRNLFALYPAARAARPQAATNCRSTSLL